jgi:hypothetical protein
VRRTLNLKLLNAVTVARFALIAGEAPAFPVLTGWFQIRPTFWAKSGKIDWHPPFAG